MNFPIFPREIFDEIFSHITEETTLKSCSLVCPLFRRNAQRILFCAIIVSLNRLHTMCKDIGLVLIVEHACHLIEYIKKLRILGSKEDSALSLYIDDCAALSNALGIFSRKGKFPVTLKSLSIEDISWQCIPSELQDALVYLTTVHSLRDITLYKVVHCPASLVEDLPPFLESLELIDVTFLSFPTTRKELPKLKSFSFFFMVFPSVEFKKFTGDAMECIANTTQLKAFNGGECNRYSMPEIEQILRYASNSLEQLTLIFDTMDLDSVSIDLNQFPHLTDIIIKVCYFTVEELPSIAQILILVTKAMKNLSRRNMIQNLSFDIGFDSQIDMTDSLELVMKDVWQEVDMICSIPQLALSKSFRGITFGLELTPPLYDTFSVLVRDKLPKTDNAGKLHIEYVVVEDE